MKKIVVILFAVLLFIPATLFAEEKVKVYMFESGGCPYCEAEMEYLKKLSGYKKTFEVVKKELYVDHIDWKPGKDYNLGVEVANAFNEAGFKDASYTGTPFVVISDIYAAATYSEDLEKYINQAIEEGDRDAVSCIENEGLDCIRIDESKLPKDLSDNSKIAGVVVCILAAVALVGMVVFIVKNKNTDDTIEETKEEKHEEVKEERKPRTTKPKTNKAKTNKKTK